MGMPALASRLPRAFTEGLRPLPQPRSSRSGALPVGAARLAACDPAAGAAFPASRRYQLAEAAILVWAEKRYQRIAAGHTKGMDTIDRQQEHIYGMAAIDNILARTMARERMAVHRLDGGQVVPTVAAAAARENGRPAAADADVPVSAGFLTAAASNAADDAAFLDAIAALSAPNIRRGNRDWTFNGHDGQKPPKGEWRSWLIMGGRGSGKTRAGAEWVQALASASRKRSDLRIALVAETLGDAREVMIDGVSGICRIARSFAPDFEVTRRRLVWPNGAVAQIFSSEDPEALRGPQFHYAWCDELAKWRHAEETFDMLQFGLRLGTDPRQLVTTTPRPVPVLKRLIADPSTRLVRLSTAGNAKNLAPGFVAALQARYGGTRLGRQEIDGELIDDRPDALWKRADLDAIRIDAAASGTGRELVTALRRIVVAVDPPSGAGEGSCCGIVVAGLLDSGAAQAAGPALSPWLPPGTGSGQGGDAASRAVILADCSVEGASPAGWARAVEAAYRRFAADRVVAEVNQGGEMVSAMLRSVDANLPITMVRATRGKFARAEPVAALYEQRRVIHAGRFVELEDQMCDFGPDGLSAGRSPDRLDALVWALTALILEGQGEPRIRGI